MKLSKLLSNKKEEIEEPLEKAEAVEVDEEENWLTEATDGQLAVDVYQDEDNIYIKSAIAGVKPEDIDISVQSDMVTIRGERWAEEKVEEKDYLYQECHWGGFSRSIILPQDTQTDKIKANLKNGILTVVLPKLKKSEKVRVEVEEE